MDAEYSVDSVISTEDDAFNGLSKTWFMSGGGQVYIFHKPENVPVAGQILTGTIAPDKRGSLKFTKKKLEPFPSQRPQPVQATIPPAKPPEPKTYKADPDKMKQEMTLETARNMSIQRQVALKATIDLIITDNRNYNQLIDTYCDMMEILSETNWRELEELKELEKALPGADVIPTTVYDQESFDSELQKTIDRLEDQEPETE